MKNNCLYKFLMSNERYKKKEAKFKVFSFHDFAEKMSEIVEIFLTFVEIYIEILSCSLNIRFKISI